jgi:uncharacterized repeat protein (TIGR04042 family)
MTFTVRWPDGRVEDCYSPSLVVHDHLQPGRRYTVAEFVQRSTTALDIASERVRARYGFACSSSMATQDQIERSTAAHPRDQLVEVLRMHPPLPQEDA